MSGISSITVEPTAYDVIRGLLTHAYLIAALVFLVGLIFGPWLSQPDEPPPRNHDRRSPMLNTKALIDTYAYVRDHPEEWRQVTWVCGTTACFAGHAALHVFGARLSGQEEESVVLTEEDADLLNTHDADYVIRRDSGEQGEWQAGDETHISHFAAAALGLTDAQRTELFYALNTMADLKRLIEEYTGVELAGAR